jgi:hypothetical protein
VLTVHILSISRAPIEAKWVARDSLERQTRWKFASMEINSRCLPAYADSRSAPRFAVREMPLAHKARRFPFVRSLTWVARWQLMLPRLAFRLIAAVLAVLALSGSLAAQSFDLAAHGQQIIALDQLMRFHPGDDSTLGWANPALDDSSWPLIRGNETWYAQGYPKLTGFAWYRFTVTLPSHAGPLALWVPLIATNFQVYADGRLIAENGAMPPHPRPRYGTNLVFPIPADLAHSGQPLTIAIRVWHYRWEYELFGGLQESMRLGDAGLIREWQAEHWRSIFWVNTQFSINCLVCLLAGLGSLVLFLLRSTDREFLWFAVWEAFNVLYALMEIWCDSHSFDVIFWRLGGAILLAGLNGSLPILIRHFGRTDRTPLYWAAIAVALLDLRSLLCSPSMASASSRSA